MSGKKIVVKQTRSANRSEKRHYATLQALGLGRIGREAEHISTPCTLGMIRSVEHLVTIAHKAK